MTEQSSSTEPSQKYICCPAPPVLNLYTGRASGIKFPDLLQPAGVGLSRAGAHPDSPSGSEAAVAFRQASAGRVMAAHSANVLAINEGIRAPSEQTLCSSCSKTIPAEISISRLYSAFLRTKAQALRGKRPSMHRRPLAKRREAMPRGLVRRQSQHS